MADVGLKDARGPHIDQSEVRDLITAMANKLGVGDAYTTTQVDELLEDYTPTSALTVLLGDYVTETAFTTALADKIDIDQLGASNGVATLDSAGTIPLGQIPSGIGGGGGLVGEIKGWGGIDLPDDNKHVWADGAALPRTAYPALFAAWCPVRAGNTTSGSAVITGLPSTTNLKVGYDVEGDGIPADTTIASIDSATQITLSANATATASAVDLRFFAYGNGDGATTFNVVDAKGSVLFGRDDMGGTPANRISATSVGPANPNGQRLGSRGGASTTSISAYTGLQIGTFPFARTIGGGDVSDGSSKVITNLPPGVVVNYIIRALP